MRPRKALDQALKYYNESQELKRKRHFEKGLASEKQGASTEPDSQIVEIVVEKAYDLQIHGNMKSVQKQNMLPFYYYDFYKFSETSVTGQGCNPVWQCSRKYEVEKGGEFDRYMSANVLKIDFIDESVDITEQGNRDYIGSARVPLRDLLQQPSRVEG